MANLEESAVWTPGVYQLETTDPVLGGPVQAAPATGGIANRAAAALANRTAYLKAQVEFKANLASPTFTGSPRAPTPAVADNSTKLATTAYVNNLVAQDYAPKTHTHPWADVTGKPAVATRWPKWGEVTEKPASFAPSAHTHAIADVTGLQGALNGKLNTVGGTLTGNLTINGFLFSIGSPNKNPALFLRDSEGNNRGNVHWDRVSDRVQISRYNAQTFTTEGWARINTNNTFQTSHAIIAPGFNGNATSADKLKTARTLKIGNTGKTFDGSGNVTWTLTDIGAAPASHTHTIANVTGLQTALDGKATTAHTHAWADVTGKPAVATRWPKWSEVTNKPAFPQVFSITALPTSNIGPIIVTEVCEVWVWVSTAHFTGYRSPLCGRPVDGHTITPLASEIDAVGGLVSKTAYAGLWGYAKENNLVVSQSVWADSIGSHLFVDISNTQFRVPDLRNQFRRYTGTDADTANARALGSRQTDEFRSHGHWLTGSGQTNVNAPNNQLSFCGENHASYRQTQLEGGAETRPVNTAFHPRIHI